MFKKPNEIPGFVNISPEIPGFINEEPKYDDKQRPFSYTANLHENAFNWENVYNWDPVQIKQDHDAEKMQDILNKFVKCNFTSADLQIIQNPLIFRLLQVLQIVVEYIAHSQMEVQTLYGKTVHENTCLKSTISRYKTKNGRLISALRNMKEVEKCPVCSSYFDSDISLDRHIHKNHFKVYDLWSHVRENKEFSVQEEVKKLNRQIDAMRILIREQQKQNNKPRKIQKVENVVQKEEDVVQEEENEDENIKDQKEEEEKSKESTDQPNIFEISDSIEDESKDNDSSKKYKYYIDPDYQPFHKAVHHDDGPYLVFQEMSDLSVSIEPQAIVEQRTKKGTDNIYYKNAKLFLNNSPERIAVKSSSNNVTKNESNNNINLNYDDISDAHKIRTGKQIKIDVHDQAHEVKMIYKNEGPRWKLRKKVEREMKECVPDVIPKSTIHQLFDKLNYYAKKKEKTESESIEEEEEEAKEEEEIELTSACYSSLQYSSERAQYYSHDGGGTTRKEQAIPSLYNPGGRKFPIKSEVHRPDKNSNEKAQISEDDVFQYSSKHEQKDKEKIVKPDISNKNDESSTSYFSTQDSMPPSKPPPKTENNNVGLLSEGSFSSVSDAIFFASGKKQPEKSPSKVTTSNKKVKFSSTNLIEEEEEPSDDEPKSIPKKKPQKSNYSDDDSLESLPVSRQRKKIKKSKSKGSTSDLTVSNQKSSQSIIKNSSSNLQDQNEFDEEEEPQKSTPVSHQRKKIRKSKSKGSTSDLTTTGQIGSQKSSQSIIKNSSSNLHDQNEFDEEEEPQKSVPLSHQRRKIRKSKSKGSTSDLTAKSSQSIIKNSSSNLHDQEGFEEEEIADIQRSKKSKRKPTNDFESENSFDKEEEPSKPKSLSNRKKKSTSKFSSPVKSTNNQKNVKNKDDDKNDYDFDSISWDD